MEHISYSELIKKCSSLLRARARRADPSRQINAPMLSVFLGSDAERFRADVHSIYDALWLESERALLSLTAAEYSPDAVLDKVNAMRALPDTFQTISSVLIPYYWDIMDDSFEEMFRLVQQPLPFPVTITVQRLYFVVCKEKSVALTAIKQERLDRLLTWAANDNCHLIVQSDTNPLGLLDDNTIVENYRVAADIMLLCNTYNPPGEPSLGEDLIFFLTHQTLFSVGYYEESKKTRDIAVISLNALLEECLSVADHATGNGNIRERLCNGTDSYLTLFDSFFAQYLESCMPADSSFWQYIPRTDGITALGNRLSAPAAPARGGLFGLFSSRSSQSLSTGITMEDSERAVRENPVWLAAWERYYLAPILAWQDSAEGAKQMEFFFSQLLSQNLSYAEMSSQLSSEITALQQLAEQFPTISLPTCSDLPSWCEQYARCRLKQTVYPLLASRLALAMCRLQQSAGSFADVLRAARQQLPTGALDANVSLAYRALAHNLVRREPMLTRMIHPCPEEDLPKLLYEAFERMISLDSTYLASFSEDLLFQSKAAAGAPEMVINNCFSKDMTRVGRLQSLDTPTGGCLYCLVSSLAGVFANIDSNRHGGALCVGDTDCVRRLYIYPMNPQKLI